MNFGASSTSPTLPPELSTSATLLLGTDPDRAGADGSTPGARLDLGDFTLSAGEALLLRL